ncbi:hypothetical protein GGS20DRAFT_568481 [Poronia punctata]|nr:hypothetical protein GGS20DRAFT_568481 [Poronia punctata]
MCLVHREGFVCGHKSHLLVTTPCITNKGVDCPRRREDPLRSRAEEKCSPCRRYDDQIRRHTNRDPDTVSRAAFLSDYLRSVVVVRS